MIAETLAEALRMPSRTSRDFVENDTAEQLSKWQEYFSEDQLTRMQAVLDYFGITTYDAVSIYPKSVTALLRDRGGAGE